jgi:predicted nucleic acid-binding protein
VVIVDTWVWVDHLKSSGAMLADLLGTGRVLAHSFVTGELAFGSIRRCKTVVESLHDLLQATVASDDEVMTLLQREQLYGLGIGFVDAHLFASVRLAPEVLLWTRDRRLRQAAT